MPTLPLFVHEFKNIANNEPPAEEVLEDRPAVDEGVVRVGGPFVVEATIPAAGGLDEAGLKHYQRLVVKKLEAER